MSQVTEVVKLRRRVLSEISRLAFLGKLEDNIEEMLTSVVTEDGPRYRCCVHKERAVLKERINLVLAQKSGTNLITAAKEASEGNMSELPVINVLPEACDQCPINKFIVTDACRNCIAHSCINSCPKKAIMVIQNKAYIDQTKCVECGLCKRSCQYSAIIEISRPCERACDLKAIKANADRRAEIDYEKCVSCGACKIACPFGAITDYSAVVQIIQNIKDSNKKVHAMVAPAIVGQFGMKVSAGQIFNAIKSLGFDEVHEVSFGADIVALEETKEFVSSVPSSRSYMTSSCCPAFVGLVDKHMPKIKENMSSTISPMIASGKLIKKDNPNAIVVFIGPCIAKKEEAKKYKNVIDYVITFEELATMLVGADINAAEAEDCEFATIASTDGNIFARAGGLVQAVTGTAKHIASDVEIKAQRAEGLSNCKVSLQQISDGKVVANFFEGMACQGGCVGGPGILTDYRVTTRSVNNHAVKANVANAPQNTMAVENSKKEISWHNHG